MANSFGARSTLAVGGTSYEIFRLDALQSAFDVARLPYSLKVLLENVLRNEDGDTVQARDAEAIASWVADSEPSQEIGFKLRACLGRVGAPELTGMNQRHHEPRQSSR